MTKLTKGRETIAILPSYGGPIEVDGYLFEWRTIKFIVHRTTRADDELIGTWRVSELATGYCAVRATNKSETRKAIVERAIDVLERNGLESVLTMINGLKTDPISLNFTGVRS